MSAMGSRATRSAAAAALIVVLTAAGAAADKVKLTFWHWGTNGGIQQGIKEFNASQDQVEVDFVPVDWNDFLNKLLLQLSAGGGPDMFSVQIWPAAGMPVNEWLQKGLILDVAPYFKRDEAELNGSRWHSFLLDRVTYGGKMAGLPYGWSPWNALEYNANLFKAAGMTYPDKTWTWSTLADADKKLTKMDGAGKITQWGQSAGDFGDWTFVQSMVQATGGSLYNAEQTKLALNSSVATGGLEEAARFITDGIAQPGGNWSGGHVALRRAAVHWATVDRPQAHVPFEPGLAVTPMDPQTGLRRVPVEIGTLGINGHTKHPEAAWEFLKFFTTHYAQDELDAWGVIQYIPVTPQGQQKFLTQNPATIGQQLATDLPAVAQGMAQAVYLPPPPINPLVTSLDDKIAGILAGDWNNEILKKMGTVQQFVEDVTPQINALLQGKTP